MPFYQLKRHFYKYITLKKCLEQLISPYPGYHFLFRQLKAKRAEQILLINQLCTIMKTLSISLLIMLTFGTVSAQNYVTLSGKVFDSGTQKPLPECNVYLSDFNYGTVTDSLGRFTLRIPARESDEYLIISFVGYLKNSIKASEINGNSVHIYMNPEIKLLEEITIRESNAVSMNDISDLPWDYREIDQDNAAVESPEVLLVM